ncbi:MAG: hypothetical protein MK209_00080 [Planctomycetes bacterium]|nr:hypothetical protein [Planctomycetota bacterium]
MPIDSASELLSVFGRMHPLILHLPIGILIGLVMLECVNTLRRQPVAPAFLVFFASVSACLAAASGVVLHNDPSYSASEVLKLHEQLGIATAACSIVVFLLRIFGARTMYRWALALTVIVMIPTGHFGAEMTHGKGFLFKPLVEPKESMSANQTTPEGGSLILASYELHIQHFFEAKCNMCHGDRKVKGGLRTDSPEALLAGGDGGPAIETGISPEDQELLHRILLPIDDDDHMPPDHKAQPSELEIQLIRAWLAAGAPFENEFELAEGAKLPLPTNPANESEGATDPEEESAAHAAPEAALSAMRKHLVHVQPVEVGSKMLWVDFAAPANTTDDAIVLELITPTIKWISDLSLARTQITDASVEIISTIPALVRLDLRETRVTTSGLAYLAGHDHLRELIVSRTHLNDAVIETLGQLPALERLWIWDAGITTEGLATLRKAMPEVHIDAGDVGISVALETEETPKLTNDASQVDPALDPETNSLTTQNPVNSICLVSGNVIDPQFNLLHDGKVIGFCCPNCPKTFQANPAKFLAKLETENDG